MVRRDTVNRGTKDLKKEMEKSRNFSFMEEKSTMLRDV